jgi:RsiW-degrading membrane proteinase PrsW (M82 family)
VAGFVELVFPFRAWVRNPALRSWPVLIFVALVVVPPTALVIFFQNPTQSTFDDAAWIFAGYFAVAWMLLLGVIVRPAQVTRQLLIALVLIALVTQVPLALALENALAGNLSNLGSSILAVGLPEELAKALPVVVIALWMRARRQYLAPVDYLFLGAVSGLVFGASEAEHYLSNGVGIGPNAVGDLVGVLNYVWRFVTDPITHACWAGLSGYFIGLAVSGQYRPLRVGWIGLAMASVLHGLNDWSGINTHPLWVVVVLVSAILLLGYAKAGAGGTAPAPAGARYPHSWCARSR